MKMYNPPRPGEIIADIYLEPFGLSARAIAKDLKVDPSYLPLFGEREHSSTGG
jgi:antitoxin HigA-1